MITHKLNKFNAPIFAIATATFLAIGKLLVGYFSGSLAILSSAVDSITDIGTSFFNFLFIKKADAPPDEEHQFGHGKLEAYASILQSAIIFGTGVFVLYKGAMTLSEHKLPEIHAPAIIMMVVAIAASFAISTVLKKVGDRENSQALEADSMHYSIDMLTNTGVLVTIVLVKVTGIFWFDTAIASLMAVYIMFSAVKLHISALRILLDAKISDTKINGIKNVLHEFGISYSSLRTRTDGEKSFVDISISLCDDMPLYEAHELCDLIEAHIKNVIKDLDITIHPEPCTKNHVTCECDTGKIRNLLSIYEAERATGKDNGGAK